MQEATGTDWRNQHARRKIDLPGGGGSAWLKIRTAALDCSHRRIVFTRKIPRPKSVLAPIDDLTQYALSNYYYEQIHLHPGKRRVARGL
jgi:hypothetical protein